MSFCFPHLTGDEPSSGRGSCSRKQKTSHSLACLASYTRLADIINGSGPGVPEQTGEAWANTVLLPLAELPGLLPTGLLPSPPRPARLLPTPSARPGWACPATGGLEQRISGPGGGLSKAPIWGDYPAELGYYPKANGQNPAFNGGYPAHIRQQQQQYQQQQYQQQHFAAAGSRYIDQLNAQQQHYY